MVRNIQKSLLRDRERTLSVLVVLSLIAAVLFTILSAPKAQADYYHGCGYGYNSSGQYGYGSTYGYGYSSNGAYGYGYGNTVGCSTGSSGSSGSGGGGATTTTAPTTTTTAPTTPPGKSERFFAHGAKGFAEVGRSRLLTIAGAGFYGQPRITSTDVGARVGVLHDHGTSLVIRVTTSAGSRTGEHTLIIRFADGKVCKSNYSVKR